MTLSRRAFTVGTGALLLGGAAPARAGEVRDSAGRQVRLPDGVSKIFAAGGPAAVVVYVLRPDAMMGWPRAMRSEEKPYVVPSVRDLPELGQLTGRGGSANVEAVLRTKPDLIVDFGSVRPTFASLADAIQQRTGISYVLVDGRFEATPDSLRALGAMVGAAERGATLARYAENLFARVEKAKAAVPEDQRPRVYLARGPDGLETGLKGSINTEIVERAGGRNVADSGGERSGIVRVSPEQILVWNPDVIVTWDRRFHELLRSGQDPIWQGVKAVREGRIHLAPTAPFGWIDRPPSVNRLIGLGWLAGIFLGDRFPFELAAETRSFYKLFYGVDVAEPELATLLAWADGRPPAFRQ